MSEGKNKCVNIYKIIHVSLWLESLQIFNIAKYKIYDFPCLHLVRGDIPA